ncbi:MAG: IgGFc-binding protein [Deltaproteobacteria bacterium]|nr:IgGFc-binding protein [Deltaproteobacteria bacterium]
MSVSLASRLVVSLSLVTGTLGGLLACSATQTTGPSPTGTSGAGANGGSGGSLAVTTGAGGSLAVGPSSGAGGSTECDGASEKTSSGCDYYSVVPDMVAGANGGCFAAFVVNPQAIEVGVEVDYAGAKLDVGKFAYVPKGAGASLTYSPLPSGKIPPGEVAILFLNRFGFSPLGLNTDCPPGIVPAITAIDAAKHGTGIGHAFHITTSHPVVAYDIYPYGGGQSAMTSATLLLPTTAWGDNYVAVSPNGNGVGFGAFGSLPVLDIVASQDGTVVDIAPKVAILAGADGVQATAKDAVGTYTLNRGQVLQLAQVEALDGSAIKANVPVGVWAGMNAFALEECCNDSAHQQIPPVRALGSEYVGVRYRNRYPGIEETPPWRIVGAIDGTTLTWEPAPPPGAPTSLAAGQVATFKTAGPFVVRSQDDKHPFYMAAYMTGGGVYDPSNSNPNAKQDGRGDAEYVNVIPPGEYLDRYVFFTDPTYPETNLVVVRKKGSSGFEDVELDCRGKLDGWQPIGSSGQYQYTYVDLVRFNFQPQQGCDNGRREMKSSLPFGLTVWGWGSADTGEFFNGFMTQYVSYAYPGGASVAPINDVVVVPNPK